MRNPVYPGQIFAKRTFTAGGQSLQFRWNRTEAVGEGADRHTRGRVCSPGMVHVRLWRGFGAAQAGVGGGAGPDTSGPAAARTECAPYLPRLTQCHGTNLLAFSGGLAYIVFS